MARTISEIKKSMTDRFMTDETLRTAYGITGDATWDNTFSTVSIENILIYIVAACAYALEVLFDANKEDVDNRIASSIVPTTRWYYSQALAFQYGDALVYNEASKRFEYAAIDADKQVVKYCAVQDAGNTIRILVAGDENGKPAVLNDDILTAFKAYMNCIKIAGVLLTIRSLPADTIKIKAKIYIDPMIITTDGTRISDGKAAVEDAVNAYLSGIVYGGTFNKTKCVDAIQAVEGVTDVELQEVQAKSGESGEYTVVTTNNYTAESGCFIAQDLDTLLTYVVQN